MNMKNLLLIVLSIVSFSLLSQTTQEEYNYLTKGYKIQIESGLDMKSGYSLQAITTHSVGPRVTEFLGLYRDGENVPCATLMIYTHQNTGFKRYLCIPSFDADPKIWNQYLMSFNEFNGEARLAVVWGVSKLSSMSNLSK